MGFVSGLLGTAGGVNGTGISGPSSANILNPTTTAQAGTAYNAAQQALGQQQAFLNATQAQNGLGNQTNVFNQLQGITSGTGPNPAKAMLAQSTGANTANQAALMAGQRGAGANAGLIARQAAMQGAANQQNAAGQAATLQANQSLNALNSQGAIANTQAAQQAQATGANTAAQQGEQAQILGGIAGQNTANVNMQTGINTANAGMAQTSMQGQQNLLGGITGGIGSALGLAEGGMIPRRQNYADGGYTMTGYDANNNDAVSYGGQPASTPNSGSQYDTPNAAVASIATPQINPLSQPAQSTTPGPKSKMAQMFGNTGKTGQPTGMALAGNALGQGIGNGLKALFSQNGQKQVDQSAAQGASQAPGTQAGGPMDNTDQSMTSNPGDIDNTQMNAARGGKVPAMVSPGERYLKPKEVKEVLKGKNPMKAGEKIPGKPKVGGAKNSYANDTVKRNLDEGGIVIPRSITQGPNAHWNAMKFVHQTLRNGKK